MKMHFTGILFLLCTTLQAQLPYADLRVNKIKARINNNGTLFNISGNPGFEVPADSGNHSVLSSGLWIAAKDASQNYYTSIATYDSSKQDFWPGPIEKNTGKTDDTAHWNYVWHVKSQEIADHKSLYNNGGYTAPWSISHWPGSNKRPFGFNQILAPFIDLNQNSTYEPEKGEVPFVSGKEAAYFIMNDSFGRHGNSGGSALGVEIYALVYGVDEQEIDQTVFVQYRIINRSNRTYDSVFVGIFTDFMLGNAHDNRIATDTNSKTYYCFNNDSIDPGGYDSILPVQGVMFLNEDLAKTISFDEGTGPTGRPQNPKEYFQYLAGRWRDDSPLKYGVNVGYNPTWPINADYVFGGPGCDNTGWNEAGNGINPGRRSMLGSMGPRTLGPGQDIKLDVAYIFTRAVKHQSDSSFCHFIHQSEKVKRYYEDVLSSVKKTETKQKMQLYPNPSSDLVHLVLPEEISEGEISIYSMQGKVVSQMPFSRLIHVGYLSAGTYAVVVKTEAGVFREMVVVSGQ